MINQEMIVSQLSADLLVEPNLLIEEVMTASYLKALFRSAMSNWDNYPALRDELATKF